MRVFLISISFLSVVSILSLVGSVKPLRAAAAAAPAPLSEELLLSIYNGDRTNGGRAARLLSAATKLEGKKSTKIALLKKSVEFGLKSMGLPKCRTTTEKALEQLGRLTDDNSTDSFFTDKKVEFYRISYRLPAKSRVQKLDIRNRLIAALAQSAEFHEQSYRWLEAARAYTEAARLSTRPVTPDLPSLRRKVLRATHMRKVQMAIDKATKDLKKDPNDVKARNKLIKFYLVEYDKPAEAVKYLNEDADEILRTYIPLALRRPFEVKLSACKEMAKWYGQMLTKEASPHAKANMLRRGIIYCDRFLDSPKRDAEGALLLGVIKGNMKKELKKLDPEPIRPPKPGSLAGGTITLDLGKGISMKLRGIPPKKVYGNDRLKGKLVAASPYYIGLTEVTQEQYEAVIGTNPSSLKGRKNPVDQVSWHEAQAFCKKLSNSTGRTVRLPTEAEWSNASEAGVKYLYFFGEDPRKLVQYAWCKTNTKDLGEAEDHYRPVATRKPNPWGLYDMYGNAWEWVFDLHTAGEEETRKIPSDAHKALGGDWTTTCRPGVFAWSGAKGKHKGWGFRVLVEYE
ncbi:MAG: SUMF1/EgtB/PvdO family nonheme iron enzyme [Phycisphaerales bacterium]|jgi:hypothetical protein|nr:SUMF1/EgtB/PvdO family nonheme iron enzyme [Phycisphaerales bacterium]